ncbi:MAG TPA: glycosyltransferase [Solirubrobacteraceae bacterium]|jgi:glycosyltransferase involved in cell wall biosynthesis|nr:glycosyltransferase [Solirubrobacteraceae bacterium]
MGETTIVVERSAGEEGALERTLSSIAAHTAAETAVSVVDEGGVAAALAAAAGGSDVVVLAGGVSVGEGWLDGLRDAVASDSIVMSASALGGGAEELGARAASLRSHSARLRPTIPAAREQCCLLSGAGLALVGAGTVAEVSARLSSLGLVHVLADDVLVGGAPPELSSIGVDDDAGPLARAQAIARTALQPLAVTVDARALDTAATGTRTYILDLIAALAAREELSLRVTLPPKTAPDVLEVLAADARIELISYDEAIAGVPRSDVVHRPQQIFSTHDLALLRLLGERVVVTNHDLIAYRCADYHADEDIWRSYRRSTRLTLAQADMVVFPSLHAREDALRENLIAPQRAHAVSNGADRLWPRPGSDAVRPAELEEGTRLLLCLGADYAHKNRPFAISLARELRDRHGWDGRLVLAGPHVEHGSSRAREQAMLEEDPTLRSLVVELGRIDDAAREWLYAHADAVVYPSVYEGFGYVPFEAAEAGVACLYAASGALVELAGPQAATLVAWDAAASADAAAPLLVPGAARERHLQALRTAAAQTTWAAVVPQLLEVYAAAVASPHRAGAPRIAEDLEREAFIISLAASAEHDRLRAEELQSANEHGRRIIDETEAVLERLRSDVGALAETKDGGALSPAQRRGLMRVATRPPLRRVLLAPFALLGRGQSNPSADK